MKEAKYTLYEVVDSMRNDFDIQKEQYDCIIKIINTVSQYHRILYNFTLCNFDIKESPN